MSLPDRSSLATVELLLALAVVAIALAYLTPLPWPFPSWPDVAGLPANPELVVPALLAVAVLAGAVADGLDVWSATSAFVALVTLWLAAASWWTLYTPGPGGVFFGGLFTLVAGIGLAATVLIRVSVGASVGGERPHPVREWLEA